MAEVNEMQSLRQLVLGLVLSYMITGAAAANPPGDRTPGPDLMIQEYARRIDMALRPVFSPLITQWVQQRYGHSASGRIRFIDFDPSGVVRVHVDAEAPNKTCVFALYYEWENGWKLVQVDNHSGSASG